MKPSEILFRCHAIGILFTDPKTNAAKEKGELSETTKSYLSDLYKQIKYDRKKDFTSKEIEKGIRQEEDAITLLSRYLGKYLKKNDKRLSNSFLTGEPDIFIGESIEKAREGYDTKASWSLWTFPDEGDKLDKNYFYQDHGYIYLTGAERWHTAYTLVNAPADQIVSEKNKIFFAMGCPDDANDRYMDKRREVEKNMIFDMAQFRRDNPHFDLDIEDWRYDIPMADRVRLFTVERDEAILLSIEERVKRCRQYMLDTYPSLFTPSLILASHSNGVTMVEGV